jgi:hypothetical protein
MIGVVALVIFGQWAYRAVLYLVFQVRWSYICSTFDMGLDALLVGCLLAILVGNDSTRLLCCGWLRRQWLSVLPPMSLVFLALAPPSNKAAGLVTWSMQPYDYCSNAVAGRLLGIEIVDYLQQWSGASYSAPFLRALSLSSVGGKDHLCSPHPPSWLQCRYPHAVDGDCFLLPNRDVIHVYA